MHVTGQAGREPRALEGLRVLEFPDPKSVLCGKLLAAMGADVVLVEPPEGSPVRRLPPHAGSADNSLYFWHTNQGKRSVALDLKQQPDRRTFLRLVGQADVLIDSFRPGTLASLGLDDATLQAANPRMIFISVTDFGLTGPFRDYQATDIVGWAMGGIMGLTGDPAREPLTAPALQGYQATSLWATLAIQSAVFRRLQTGQGSRIDLSLQDVLFDMSETNHSFYLCNGDIIVRSKGDHPLSTPFRNFKSKDGYAFVSGSSRGQWASLVQWMDECGIELGDLKDPALGAMPERLKRRADINRVTAIFASRTPSDVLWREGAKRNISCGTVRRIPEVMQDDQLQARGFFHALPDPRKVTGGETYPVPSVPFRGRGGVVRYGTHVPLAGEHTQEVVREWSRPGRAWPEPTKAPRHLPLGGAAFMEFTLQIAGPTLGRVLGDLGATIIKVEPREIGEPCRILPPFPDHVTDLNKSYTFHDLNRNKMSLAIDLKQPRATELIQQLARQVNGVVENFTAGTMARLNLSYETLSANNPGLVMGSITGYGQDGPRRGWPCNHPTISALCGLTGLFCYEGEEPLGFGHSHMDMMTGYTGAIAVLDGLLRQETTGLGDHMDISMLETGVNLVGVELMDWHVNHHEARGVGNRSGALGATLQGCYPCRGVDQWIVITAPDAQALSALGKLAGKPDFASVADLEQAIGRWTGRNDPWEAFHTLQQLGIPAGVVSRGPDLIEKDGNLLARGLIKRLPHTEMGEVPLAQCPIVMDGRRLEIRAPGSMIGEHNEHVLRTMLGLSEEEYLSCAVEQVV